MLDLNITRTSPGLYSDGFTDEIAALPGGGAVIRHYIYNNKTEKILMIMGTFSMMPTCSSSSSLLFTASGIGTGI